MKYILAVLLLATLNSTNAQSLIRYYENAKVGYKNESNEIIVKPIYEAGSEFVNGMALVVFNKHRGFIDATGKEVIDLLYDDATMFDEQGLAAVKYGGKYGYINKKGDWEILPFFENAFSFHNGLARVVKNGKYGFINTKGDFVVQPIYLYANDFIQKITAVQNEQNKWGYINSEGKIVLPFKYDMATVFSNKGEALVSLNKKLFFINEQGTYLRDKPKHPEEIEREEIRKEKQIEKK